VRNTSAASPPGDGTSSALLFIGDALRHIIGLGGDTDSPRLRAGVPLEGRGVEGGDDKRLAGSRRISGAAPTVT